MPSPAVKLILRGKKFAGPVDIAGPAVWVGGMRAMSAAYAGGKIIRVVRASDSAELDINSLTNGKIDLGTLQGFLSGTTGKVVTVYDQSANANHATQGTDATRPTLTLAGVGNGYPIITFAANQALVTGAITQAQPFVMSSVAKRTGNFTTQTQVFGSTTLGHGGILFRNATNTWAIYSGTALLGTASDSVWHTVQGLFNDTGSIIDIDGTQTTGAASATGMTAEALYIGESPGWADVIGTWSEGGLWSGNKSPSFATIVANQRAFYQI